MLHFCNGVCHHASCPGPTPAQRSHSIDPRRGIRLLPLHRSSLQVAESSIEAVLGMAPETSLQDEGALPLKEPSSEVSFAPPMDLW